MPASILVNGQDLSTIGVYVAFAPGLGDAPDRSVETHQLLGRAGSLLSGPVRHGPGVVVLEGSIDPAARTVAALEEARRVAKDLFTSGPVSLVFTDTAGVVKRFEGLRARFRSSPRLNKQHVLATQVADFSVSVVCPSPFARDLEPTILAMPTAGTRYPVALGTAPSGFKARATVSNPVFTYRTAGGVPVWTLTITKTATASEDWFDLDATTARIWYYDNGVRSDALAAEYLTGGQVDWPRPLDPQDGDYATSQWPTLECSVANAELLYWRWWL